MNGSNTVTDPAIGKTSVGGSNYISIDGMVKYCITAPLLELPIDFKEWHKPTMGNTAQRYPM